MEMNTGTSVSVPSVQELAKHNPTSVPARYVRPEQDPPTIPAAAFRPQVPVIDMQKLLAGAGDDHNSELDKFHLACKDWGFFQVINHGVSEDLVERVKKEVEELFNSSMEEKKKWGQKAGETEGFGHAFVVSEEQKLDWADLLHLTTLPSHLTNSHLFQTLPPNFRETVLETYSEELRVLALKLLDTMAKALKIEGDDMKQLFEEGWQIMRMNYYPPCPEPERVIGLNPHSDAAGVTILLQLNQTDGLQVKKDGLWVPVTPLPNAFVINVGDSLEIVTNGIYKSIEHRAIVNSEKERLSIATFYTPRKDGELGPVPSLITPATPALFRRITTAEYFKRYFSRELQGKSSIDSVRI